MVKQQLGIEDSNSPNEYVGIGKVQLPEWADVRHHIVEECKRRRQAGWEMPVVPDGRYDGLPNDTGIVDTQDPAKGLWEL